MRPFFNIFGRQISSYSVMTIIGMIAVFGYSAIRCRQKKYSYNDELYFLVFCFAFLLVGAALLYQITVLPNTIKILPYLFKDFDYFRSNFSVGIVFYGGLFGVIWGACIYSKVFKQDAGKLMMITAPSIPLFHIFGRIGCFLAGCCHGVANEKFGIAYTEAVLVENGIPFLPTQLYEAFGNLIIFIILCIQQRHNNKHFKPLGLYFILYGTMRFIIEFWRGDTIRGIWGPFSTSQWISLIIVPLGIYCLVASDEQNFIGRCMNHEKPKESQTETNAAV